MTEPRETKKSSQTVGFSRTITGTGGFVEESLYRGTDRRRAEEIGRTVSDAIGMGYDEF